MDNFKGENYDQVLESKLGNYKLILKTFFYKFLIYLLKVNKYVHFSFFQENLAYEASELFRFVIKHCGHDRREIFRNNMEVVKTILECWKDVLEIPYE